MTRSDETRVFVLDTPRGTARELTPAQAGLAAAAPPAGPALSATLRERGAAAVVVTGAAGPWLDAVHARGWITPVAGADLDAWLPAWQARLDEGHVPAYKFGRVIRLQEGEVDGFISSARIEPGTLEHLYPESKGAAVDDD